MSEREQIAAELAALDQIEAEVDHRIGKIESVLEDHPIRQFIPLGMPGSFGCVACRNVFLAEGATGTAPCPSCGEACQATRGFQYEALLCDSVEILASGGNRSGKSKFQVYRWCLDITGDYPDWYPQQLRLFPDMKGQRPVKLRMMAPTYEKGINDVIWPLFLEFLPRSLRTEPKRNSQGGITLANFPNGAEVSFLTYAQPIKFYEGWHGHGAGYDEPPDDKGYYTSTMRGLLDLNGRSTLAMTPIKTCAWVDKRFVRSVRSRKDYPRSGPYSTRPAHFLFDLSDNPTIREERKAHFEDLLDDDEKGSRIHGNLIALNFLVLRQWDDRMHVAAPAVVRKVGNQTYVEDPLYTPPEGPAGLPEAQEKPPEGFAPVTLYCVVDPADAKAQTVVYFAAWPPDKLGVTKKRVIRTLQDHNAQTFEEAVVLMKGIEEEIGLPGTRIMDPNFGKKMQASTGRIVKAEWAAAGQLHGWPMYFIEGIDAVELGHNAVRSALLNLCADGTPEFAICANCPELIDACRYGSYTGNYELDKKSPYKDWLDCLRYGLLSGMTYEEPFDEDSVERDHDYVPDPVAGY